MIIHGKKMLVDFQRGHADAKKAIDIWVDGTEKAEWRSPVDIKRDYASASFLADNRVIFNIRGRNYRLVIIAVYAHGLVKVDWVGTHAEYSRIKW